MPVCYSAPVRLPTPSGRGNSPQHRSIAWTASRSRLHEACLCRAFPKALYKGRARIEETVGKLKRFKRIALRCEKTAINFASFLAIAASFILIKSVHTA
ncbi:transposase [Rhizobium mongolense]|uniref:Transposase n=2 Tax=Rhizobium mongolense TaxID=57676 RepID=A0ABR6IXA7_9HYPH|nr:transposase [Rhizobium mongolense]TVZ75019.1 DDE family transposase [Rhizobium mongolense USDA 1844]